jgi:AcrR family transcriptional regulator
MSNGDATATLTKGERTRRRLLELAVRRFANEGYRATSVSAIAREAGISQATVYAYFDSKEALFEAAVDVDAADLIAEARAAVDDDLPLATRIPRLLVSFREQVAHHPLARRVLAGQEPEVIGRVADLPALREITAQFAERLAQAQTAGELRADVDVDELAIGIETVVLALLMAIVQVPAAEADQRESAVLTVFQALLSPPS